MAYTITLTLRQYKCLREHLEAIDKIIGGKDLVGGLASEQKAPKPEPKRTKPQRINDYKKLIESGQRAKKPEHLKK
jgi:hypothetical protein